MNSRTYNVNVENMAMLSTVIHNIHAAARQHGAHVEVVIKVKDEPPVKVGEFMATAALEQAKADKVAMAKEAERIANRRKEAQDRANFVAARDGAIHQAQLEAEAKARRDGISNVETIATRKAEAARDALAKFKAAWDAKHNPPAPEVDAEAEAKAQAEAEAAAKAEAEAAQKAEAEAREKAKADAKAAKSKAKDDPESVL